MPGRRGGLGAAAPTRAEPPRGADAALAPPPTDVVTEMPGRSPGAPCRTAHPERRRVQVAAGASGAPSPRARSLAAAARRAGDARAPRV